MENMEVYKAISAVQGALAKDGIGKDQTNKVQGFKYRGIDDVYNALAPLLSANGLCILPRMMSKEVVERASKAGGALFYTTVTAEFDLVSSTDGSKHTVSSYGEALDSGDKSVGKAMSYAYKAMAFMTFSIPTDGENDPDEQSHEVAQKTQPSAPQQATGHGNCKDCGSAMVPGKSGKPYCVACYKKWKTQQEAAKAAPLPVKADEFVPPYIDDEAEAMYGTDGKHRGSYSIEE